jgi:glycosyltransferase involved in cell wall biosynthesis
MNRPRVAAIVPAFNEERTIVHVIEALAAAEGIDEILVVSDGSTDETVALSRRHEVATYHLLDNHGKASAMALGLSQTAAPIVLFVDGDILDLTAAMIRDLVAPVAAGRAAMNIGVRARGAFLDAFHRRYGPMLSGIRCLRREVFEAVPEDFVKGYRIETALNWSCRQLGLALEITVLNGLKHLVKEKKRGLFDGVWGRCRMFLSVFAAFLRLKLDRPPLRTALPPGVPARPSVEFVRY